MNRIAKFEKVSYKQFSKDFTEIFGIPENFVKEIYNNIKLPKRATSGSAGYDIFMYSDISLEPGETVKIPTGIRARIDNGWVLSVFPRSGLGFKFRLQLDNTVGIIDADYYNSDNEGHIFLKMTNNGNKIVTVESGKGIAQGIFLPFGITVDDETNSVRNGGFGSTDKKII